MLTPLSYFGQSCFLVPRRLVDDFSVTHPECTERDMREALWMLRQVDAPAALTRALEDAAGGARGAVEPSLTVERLRHALQTGALRFYVQPRNIPLTLEEPRDLIPEDYQEPVLELPRHFIEVRLVDEDENPRDGERFRVVLADGTEISGRLDRNGVTRIPDVPGGPCRWSFPELHPDEWDMAS